MINPGTFLDYLLPTLYFECVDVENTGRSFSPDMFWIRCYRNSENVEKHVKIT